MDDILSDINIRSMKIANTRFSTQEQEKNTFTPILSNVFEDNDKDDTKMCVFINIDSDMFWYTSLTTTSECCIFDLEVDEMRYVHPRPFLTDFLKYIRLHFNVTLVTSDETNDNKQYMSVIDPDNTMQLSVYPLVSIDMLDNVDKHRTIFIDTSNNECPKLPGNSIIIPAFTQSTSENDRVLLNLTEILRYLSRLDDVRPFLFHHMNNLQSVEQGDRKSVV